MFFIYLLAFFQETTCLYERNGTEGIVNRTDIDKEIVETAILHSLNLDCLWVIEVQKGWKVRFFYLMGFAKLLKLS